MPQVLVIDVVGLTQAGLGEHTPALSRLAARGFSRPMSGVLPAVTCSAQATMLTGLPPAGHGIVGNGWFFRELGEVWLWRQSSRLVHGEMVWDAMRERWPERTCAQMFWWFNMGTSCDWSATPRPVYWADGRKSPDFYARPPELKSELQGHLGEFPLFQFWGPGAGIASSRWISRAARHVFETRRPSLTLVYLPHLDYVMQRQGPHGPDVPAALRQVDAAAGELIAAAEAAGAEILVVSEYGIEEVTSGVHVNRALREAGLLETVHNAAGELLDPLVSRAFAVADHQIAHVYVRDESDVPVVRALLEGLDGVGAVLDGEGKARAGIDHANSGELVAIAAPGRWFTYYYWLDETRAPDFARMVEIHRKPGYDPVELFVDPRLALGGKPAIAWRLLRKALGMRMKMDVIPLDDRLVRGSHGRLLEDPAAGALLISSARVMESDRVEMASVKDRILATLAL
jgi:predicted AlkP superfamily pyrophosphatase or phosphodiesterase